MSPSTIIAISLIFAIAIIFVVVFILLKKKHPKKDNKEKFVSTENFTVPFKIYNHLQRPISIDIAKDGKLEPLVKLIKPEKSITLPKDKVAIDGAILHISCFFGNKKQRYSEIFLDLSRTGLTKFDGLPRHHLDYGIKTVDIKELHIGMVTSRIIGDYSVSATTRPVQGMPFVRIKNMSSRPLSLNKGKIKIPPFETLSYQGENDYGVALGTVFHDDDLLYRPFQYDIPSSDIYYGLSSDLNQPIFGGWQFEFDDHYDNPAFMFPLPK